MSQQRPPTAAEAAGIADTREFLARFSLDIMPFCPLGMALLHDLARTRPDLYEWARERGFGSLDHPGFAPTALGRHVLVCLHCNSPC